MLVYIYQPVSFKENFELLAVKLFVIYVLIQYVLGIFHWSYEPSKDFLPFLGICLTIIVVHIVFCFKFHSTTMSSMLERLFIGFKKFEECTQKKDFLLFTISSYTYTG